MDKLTIEEAAMRVILDKLVDPWHKTFARDVVEMYLKHSNKESALQGENILHKGGIIEHWCNSPSCAVCNSIKHSEVKE